MAETRIQAEGTLRFVQGSGSGRTWATGASQPSGTLGYVQSFSYTSAQTVTTVMERGVPDHHKITQKAPITVAVNYFWTGGFPSALTASGNTMPLLHLEFRASAAEIGNGSTGFYYQFMGAALQQAQFTEGAGDTPDAIQATYMCLAMTGPTGSGYLS